MDFLDIELFVKEEAMSSPMAINTNIASINATRNMTSTGRGLNNSIQRLSSGLKINSASDDAAGMAVSEGLTAQVRGFQQGMENANEAIALLQTAEGSYNSISDIMIRMRELAVQAASDTLTDKERAYLNTEFEDLTNEITRISDVAEYNGIQLLTGTSGAAADGDMVFQVGTRNTVNDQIKITLKDQDSTALGIEALGVDNLANSQTAIATIDTALDQLATDRATLGSKVNELTSSVDNLATTIENLSAANSQIKDADLAKESADFTKHQVLMQSGVAMLSQANGISQMALRLLG
jgi:flagellin